jgi:histidine phosphotransferase ChpT
MTERVELEALDLAALLCSRVCHDIISPVGAIINGLEVLDEDNSEDMREFANSLIKRSARQASAKLQFARLAFGAAGSAGAEIDLGDAQKVATSYMEGEKAEFSWEAPRVLMPKNLVKLLLNLILLANAAVRAAAPSTSTSLRRRRRAFCCARRDPARGCRPPSRSWCPAISPI